ncbi:hypothetical protein BDN71DRAFT_1514688 [Pleurotus eryngii]|uniref:Uncharacterized protein n=1 Tax=Pleurotus eryngii TaxID=5323 RepID=A0A9P5ZFX7_PLEER|nr:hypothetical protein BDN71DRAFT_1514688 [Pleurotus eryngii]
MDTPPTTPPTATIPIEDTPVTPSGDVLRPRSDSDVSSLLPRTEVLNCTRVALKALSKSPALTEDLRNKFEALVAPIFILIYNYLSGVQWANCWPLEDMIVSYALIVQNGLSIPQLPYILNGLSTLASSQVNPAPLDVSSQVRRFLALWESKRSAYSHSPGPWFWWRVSSEGLVPETDPDFYNYISSDAVLVNLAILHHEMLVVVEGLPDAQEAIKKVEAWFFLILVHFKAYSVNTAGT